MKAFKFSLESVLSLRSQEEDAAKNAYAEAVAFAQRTQLSLEAGLGELEFLQETLSTKRQGTSTKDDQLVYLQAIRQQRSFCDTLTQRLVRAEQLKKVRFDLWMEARQKTQMLDKLKSKQKVRYDSDMARMEEKNVDDLVSARWAVARRGAAVQSEGDLQASFGYSVGSAGS
ncbi:MAG: hypothetical protein EBS01_02850, partial [Verrucomicrobia bacterium]|nr:hypothetical protein [Verrucomicrobiota bacterium]